MCSTGCLPAITVTEGKGFVFVYLLPQQPKVKFQMHSEPWVLLGVLTRVASYITEHPTFRLPGACHHAMQCQQTPLEMDLGLDSGQLCSMGHNVFTIYLLYLITEKVYLTFSCLYSSACEPQINVSLDYTLLERLILKIITLVADLNFT